MRVELSKTQLHSLRNGHRLRVAWPIDIARFDPNLAEGLVHAALGDSLHSAVRSVSIESVSVSYPDGRPQFPADMTQVFGAIIRPGKSPRKLSYQVVSLVVELARDPASPAAPGVQWVRRVSHDGLHWFPIVSDPEPETSHPGSAS